MASKNSNYLLLFILLCLILFSLRWFYDLMGQPKTAIVRETQIEVKAKEKAPENRSIVLRSDEKLVPSDPSLKIFEVMSFGAVGDGVTDDTAAIQTTIDQAIKLGGGKVYFPKGVYLLKDSLYVRGDHITLEGAGWDAELRMMAHPQRVITIENAKDCIVRNLQVSLGVTGVERHDQDEGIYVTGISDDFLIENILGNGKGIMVRGETSQGIIRSNTIHDTLADGIHITNGASSIEILNNSLTNTGDDAIAVVSYETNKNLVQNIKIIGNQIKNSKARGIAHVGGNDVTIWRNTIDGTSSSGILVDKDLNYHSYPSYNTSIKDNTISHAGSYSIKRGNQFGIEVSGGSFYVAIENNIVENGIFRGISIGASNTIVRFNRVLGNGESGIQIDANEVTVEDNIVEMNGKYGLYSKGTQGLKINRNIWTNNNVMNQQGVGNLMLMNSDSAEVSNNTSADTRVPGLIERTYELSGTCKNLIFDKNTSEGRGVEAAVLCKE